jgi:hypothetical protein
MLGNVDSIITGHSTVMAPADLKQFAEFNDDFLTAVREAKTAGRTIDDFVNGWTVPAKYAGYTADPKRVRLNAELIWKELR